MRQIVRVLKGEIIFFIYIDMTKMNYYSRYLANEALFSFFDIKDRNSVFTYIM